MKEIASLFVIGAILLIEHAVVGAEAGALEGTYRCVSATVDGRALTEDAVKRLRLTLTKDRYKTERGSEVLFDSTYKVDTTTKPHHISMVGTEGELAGKEALGILAVEGDTIKICYTMPGNPRPVGFESKPGSKAYLIEWKREDPR